MPESARKDYGILIPRGVSLLALFFCLSTGMAFAMGSRPSKDTTPPQVSITSPVNNATVSGNVTINVLATDNKGISKVGFYVDNSLKSTDTSSPYAYSWDTTSAANSAHALKAIAYDTSNNSKQAQINVTVNNPASPPPPPSDPELNITSISASGSNSAHPPQAAIDKNLSTYWQGN